MPLRLTPIAKETNRNTNRERSAGVPRSNQLNRAGAGGGASGCLAVYVGACAWWRRGMGRGRGRGRRSRSRSAGGGARGREQRREGGKEGSKVGRQARRSVTEAVEGGESPAAASRCVAARASGGGSRRVVLGEAGTGGVGAGAWGRGTGKQRGGSLRWCSRCRALLAFLPARWAPPAVFLASGAVLPAPPRYVLIPSGGFHGAPQDYDAAQVAAAGGGGLRGGDALLGEPDPETGGVPIEAR